MLVGQTVNAYRDVVAGIDFGDLCGRVAALPGLESLSFISPHPKDFTEKIIADLARIPAMSARVQLPLQFQLINLTSVALAAAVVDRVATALQMSTAERSALHVLATALFDRPAFRACVSHGIVLGNDGAKMSKSLRNYPDVNEVFDTFGSDAMRWFLMASPVLRGGKLVVTEQGIREGVRQAILPLWN